MQLYVPCCAACASAALEHRATSGSTAHHHHCLTTLPPACSSKSDGTAQYYMPVCTVRLMLTAASAVMACTGCAVLLQLALQARSQLTGINWHNAVIIIDEAHNIQARKKHPFWAVCAAVLGARGAHQRLCRLLATSHVRTSIVPAQQRGSKCALAIPGVKKVAGGEMHSTEWLPGPSESSAGMNAELVDAACCLHAPAVH